MTAVSDGTGSSSLNVRPGENSLLTSFVESFKQDEPLGIVSRITMNGVQEASDLIRIRAGLIVLRRKCATRLSYCSQKRAQLKDEYCQFLAGRHPLQLLILEIESLYSSAKSKLR